MLFLNIPFRFNTAEDFIHDDFLIYFCLSSAAAPVVARKSAIGGNGYLIKNFLF